MDSNGRFALMTCSIDMSFSPENLDRSIQLLRSVVGRTLAKTGCKACTVGKDTSENGLVRYHEMWDSQATFERHVRSEEFRRVLMTMDMCRIEPRVVLGNLTGHTGIASLRELREKKDHDGE
jgi:quinol monooxygenase YgiN